MRSVIGLTLVVMLAGCASTSGIEGEGELERAMRECRDRGGILTPIGAGSTGRVETDFACQFNGPPSRIRTPG